MLVLDLDDTLLNDDLTISKENIDAIMAAKELGVYILFCSGRSNDSIRQYIDKLDIHDDHEYFVSFNGARIDSVKGENIFKRTLSGEMLTELVKIGKDNNITTLCYDSGYLLIEEESELIKRYQSLTNMKTKIVPDLSKIKQSTKVLFNCNNIPLLEQVQKTIQDKFGTEVNTFFSKPTYLEALNKDANKGLGVKYMAEKLGISSQEVIAMGDSYNDVYMIEYAGLGVAVKNAREGVKKIADYVTSKTNNEGAVSEVIHKFILNQ